VPLLQILDVFEHLFEDFFDTCESDQKERTTVNRLS
jgi:hypothetical protein